MYFGMHMYFRGEEALPRANYIYHQAQFFVYTMITIKEYFLTRLVSSVSASMLYKSTNVSA